MAVISLDLEWMKMKSVKVVMYQTERVLCDWWSIQKKEQTSTGIWEKKNKTRQKTNVRDSDAVDEPLKKREVGPGYTQQLIVYLLRKNIL